MVIYESPNVNLGKTLRTLQAAFDQTKLKATNEALLGLTHAITCFVPLPQVSPPLSFMHQTVWDNFLRLEFEIGSSLPIYQERTEHHHDVGVGIQREHHPVWRRFSGHESIRFQ